MTWLRAQWAWLVAHKTRVAGWSGALAGAVQAYLPQLGIFLSVKQMAATTMIIGITVAVIGHINGRSDAPPS